MKLLVAGAAGTVTGSKYLLETDSHRLLVDCGLFQGVKQLRLLNWQGLGFAASEVDATVLTHAHIDHSGALPLLYKGGYRGRFLPAPRRMTSPPSCCPIRGSCRNRTRPFSTATG